MLDVFNFTPHRLTVLERPQEADPVTREYMDCGCVAYSDGDKDMCPEHDAEFDRQSLREPSPECPNRREHAQERMEMK